jgi:hypothetical protein
MISGLFKRRYLKEYESFSLVEGFIIELSSSTES